VWQTCANFVAGFHDLDLRDATGHGHGAMILAEGVAAVATAWKFRLLAGELVGIAATERRGGSRVREITTAARSDDAGTWHISGEKCWVSRLTEAVGFVVFFRDPRGRISAAIIDATDPGLAREVLKPAGLSGWAWGKLHLREVPIDPCRELIGRPGDGLGVFRRHFARFRPLATSTALGCAAGVHTTVAHTLIERLKTGVLVRARDSTLVTLGRTYAEIQAAFLSTLAATRLASAQDPHAELTAQVGKASGVDAAFRAINELAPLIGAIGYQRAHPIAKARIDVAGLLYADGVHDSLYRAGGQRLLGHAVQTEPGHEPGSPPEEAPTRAGEQTHRTDP
jgi:alkylation response protein AidB-like acyl-CoA dehydrogenase